MNGASALLPAVLALPLVGAILVMLLPKDEDGLARGVAYIDRISRQPRELRAKAVALCASTLESTRILLNSGEGFCNSSGALGRYLMDHVSGGATGRLPIREQSKWTGAPRRPIPPRA